MSISKDINFPSFKNDKPLYEYLLWTAFPIKREKSIFYNGIAEYYDKPSDISVFLTNLRHFFMDGLHYYCRIDDAIEVINAVIKEFEETGGIDDKLYNDLENMKYTLNQAVDLYKKTYPIYQIYSTFVKNYNDFRKAVKTGNGIKSFNAWRKFLDESLLRYPYKPFADKEYRMNTTYGLDVSLDGWKNAYQEYYKLLDKNK